MERKALIAICIVAVLCIAATVAMCNKPKQPQVEADAELQEQVRLLREMEAHELMDVETEVEGKQLAIVREGENKKAKIQKSLWKRQLNRSNLSLFL